jgi:hypothetical protein
MRIRIATTGGIDFIKSILYDDRDLSFSWWPKPMYIPKYKLLFIV